MNVQAGIQVSDLRGVVRRRAPVVLGVTLVVALVAYLVAMGLPNEYESYATVLVEPQAVDPGLVEAGVATTDLNRRLHLIGVQCENGAGASRLGRRADDFLANVGTEERLQLTRPLAYGRKAGPQTRALPVP